MVWKNNIIQIFQLTKIIAFFLKMKFLILSKIVLQKFHNLLQSNWEKGQLKLEILTNSLMTILLMRNLINSKEPKNASNVLKLIEIGLIVYLGKMKMKIKILIKNLQNLRKKVKIMIFVFHKTNKNIKFRNLKMIFLSSQTITELFLIIINK